MRSRLLEQTLASREGVLGPDHPDTQTSRKNLAKAYQDVGRTTEAIPLLERSLAGRHRALRPGHPHTQISRKNLVTAYRDEGRVARESQAPADAAANGLSVSFRRPPADPATPVLPGGFRRPPADQAGRLPSDRIAHPSAKPPDHSVAQADTGRASHRRRARPRGSRGDHARRPGGHCRGVRLARGCSVQLLPLDVARLGRRSRVSAGHVRPRRCHAERVARAFQAAPVAVRAGPQRMSAPDPA